MKPISAKITDVVEVVFDDHCEGGDELLRFVVYGRLIKKTRTQLTIACWCYNDSDDVDDNVNVFNISRGSVISCYVLKSSTPLGQSIA